MGRRPKPTHLKLIQGNPGKRSLNDAEPNPPRGVPSPPDHMTSAAKEAWNRLAPLLDQMGILTIADALELERLCECLAEVQECREVLQRLGGTYETKNLAGERMYRSRPEVARLADADRRFRSYALEFGLTPAARSQVRVTVGCTPDPLDRYFS
jgi:P27 family predicted phage terminase small subunit